MSADVTPVRAWAEYDEWSVFFDAEHELVGLQWFPKGAVGEASSNWHGVMGGLTDALSRFTGHLIRDSGPLRSLRVLFSNGTVLILELDRSNFLNGWLFRDIVEADTWDGGRAHDRWLTTVLMDRTGLTDGEAVDRAIEQAVKWLEKNVDE